MDILVVYQSVVDMIGSFFTLLTTAVVVDGTHMSRDSIYDQFVCHVWLVKHPCTSYPIYAISMMSRLSFLSRCRMARWTS